MSSVSGKKPKEDGDDSVVDSVDEMSFVDSLDEVPIHTPTYGAGKKWSKLSAALQGDDEFSFSSVSPDKRRKPPTNIKPEPKGKPEANPDNRGFVVRILRKIFS